MALRSADTDQGPVHSAVPGWAVGEPAGLVRGGEIGLGRDSGTSCPCSLHSSGHVVSERQRTCLSDRVDSGTWTQADSGSPVRCKAGPFFSLTPSFAGGGPGVSLS